MSQTIGEVNINLRMSLAQFKQDVQQGTTVAGASARQMGSEMKAGTNEARGSLMLLSEEFGVHIPRHLQKFIAGLPGVGAALNAAFSAVAVIALVEVLVKVFEKLNEMGAAASKLAKALRESGDIGAASMHKLNEEVLKLDIQIEELSGHYLQALHDKLLEIDNTNVDRLVEEFKKLGASFDETTKQMEVGWFRTMLHIGGNDAQLHVIQQDFDSIITRVRGLSELGDKVQIGSLLEDSLQRVNGELAHSGDLTAKVVMALQQERDRIIDMQKEYARTNDIIAKQDKIAKTDTSQKTENNKDGALSQQKELEDAKAKLTSDSVKLRADIAQEGLAKVRAITLASVAEEVDELVKSSDEKYTADVNYWHKVIALHGLSTEEDQKKRKEAQEKIRLLAVTHQDDLVNIEIAGEAKRLQVMKDAAAQAETEKKAEIALAEKMAQEKLALLTEEYKGKEEHVKVLLELHRISAQQELQMEIDLHRQQYEADVARLNQKVQDAAEELIIEANKNGQILTMDQALAEARKNLDSEYLKAKQVQTNADQKATDAAMVSQQKQWASLGQTIGQTITQGTLFGASWKNALKSILVQVAELILKMTVLKALGGVSGGGSSSGGGLGGIFGGIVSGIFGGFKAEGGPVSPNHAYMVGENGPEMFAPGVSGHIIPNGGLKEATPQVSFTHIQNITTPDADSFQKSKSQMAADAYEHMFAAHARNR